MTEIFCNLSLKVSAAHKFNAIFALCAYHTLSKNQIMICNISFIHSKFQSVPYHIASISCVSGVKSCVRNYQSPYLEANSVFKNSLFS